MKSRNTLQFYWWKFSQIERDLNQVEQLYQSINQSIYIYCFMNFISVPTSPRCARSRDPGLTQTDVRGSRLWLQGIQNGGWIHDWSGPPFPSLPPNFALAFIFKPESGEGNALYRQNSWIQIIYTIVEPKLLSVRVHGRFLQTSSIERW